MSVDKIAWSSKTLLKLFDIISPASFDFFNMVRFLSQVLRLLSTIQVSNWWHIRQNDLATIDDIFRGELWQAGFIRHNSAASTTKRR